MRTLFFLSLSAVLAAGCGRNRGSEAGRQAVEQPAASTNRAAAAPAADRNQVVAYVNDVKMTRGELEDEVSRRILGTRILVPVDKQEAVRERMRRKVVRDFLVSEVFLQEAKARNIEVEDADRQVVLNRLRKSTGNADLTLEQYFRSSPMGKEWARREFERSMMMEKLVQSEIEGKAKVTDEAVKAFAEEAAETRVRKHEELAAIREEILAGADFAETARRRSDDVLTRSKGGDLGALSQQELAGRFGQAVASAAFSQQPGKLGDVIDGLYGMHLLLVREHTPAKPAEGDEPAKPETVTLSHIALRAPLYSTKQMQNEVKMREDGKNARAYMKRLFEQYDAQSVFPDITL